MRFLSLFFCIFSSITCLYDLHFSQDCLAAKVDDDYIRIEKIYFSMALFNAHILHSKLPTSTKQSLVNFRLVKFRRRDSYVEKLRGKSLTLIASPLGVSSFSFRSVERVDGNFRWVNIAVH